VWAALPEGGGATSCGHGPLPAGELCKNVNFIINGIDWFVIVFQEKVEADSRGDSGNVGGGAEAMGEKQQDCVQTAGTRRAGGRAGSGTVVDQYPAACSCRMNLMRGRVQAGQRNNMLAARLV